MAQKNSTQSRGGGLLIEPSPRWVRVVFNGVVIANTKRALFVHETGEHRKLATYFFPRADVRTDLLQFSGENPDASRAGATTYFTINAQGRSYENAAFSYEAPTANAQALKGHVGFVWDKVDQWLEEEEPIFRHARVPYKRVDAIPSSRHVKVVLGGEVIAESRRPVLVFESGLRVRYYLPMQDVREDLLQRTESRTSCPYKGHASYWSAHIGGKIYEDIVWSYLQPLPEVQHIARFLAFYHEKVDAAYIDGKADDGQLWNDGANAFYV
ncbi:DUF427 domain-containing protein [Steroidobacter cummioxidans]|uniref:DUF427 domain-containing protein n=1 Tax=Steroidobacter cummioxidans TaxID=1803913 RepID=UPI000E31C4E1|nr:DUF427 domain-containing protein [Steroidobacter cummioxidans]